MHNLTMPRLHVGDGWKANALTLFPVWAETPSTHGLALGPGTVEVAERDGSPVVGQLVVRNAGSKPALLLEGEMLEGGWQHRVLNGDLLLEPGVSHVADVSCIEHGRWNGGSSHRRSSRMSSGNVRAALRTDQGERQHSVWRQVSRFDQTLGASPTSSLVDHLDNVTRASTGSLGDIPRRPVSGQRGVIVALGGEPAWLELMPSGGALASRWRSLVEAAMLDAAMAPPIATSGQAARDFAMNVARVPLLVAGLSGSGRAVAGERRALSARGIVRGDGTLLHSLVMNLSHRELVLA